MKFIQNYWRKFEFPSMEKLNTMFEALVTHACKRRNLVTGELMQVDPGINMEHWASAIRTIGIYADVQDALDHMGADIYDTKFPFKTIAPESRRNTVTADYYIDDDGVNSATQLEEAIAHSVYASRGAGILFFHAGEYLFKDPVTLSNRVSFLGEPGAIIHFRQGASDNGRFVTVQCNDDPMLPIVFSGLTFISGRTIIRGSGLLIDNCTFAYDEVDVDLTAEEGLIETVDLSDAAPIPTVVSNSLFCIQSEIGTGAAYSRIRRTRAVLHKHGELLVQQIHVKRTTPNQKWFESGIVAESGSSWLRIIDSDIRAYGEAVTVQGGALYIEGSSFYRHAGRATAEGLVGLWIDDDTDPTSSTLNTIPALHDGDTLTEAAYYFPIPLTCKWSVGANFGRVRSVNRVKLYDDPSYANHPADTGPGWGGIYGPGGEDSLAVYTSNDNATWTLRETIHPAPRIPGAHDSPCSIDMTLSSAYECQYIKLHCNLGQLSAQNGGPIGIAEIDCYFEDEDE